VLSLLTICAEPPHNDKEREESLMIDFFSYREISIMIRHAFNVKDNP
jgi:hypothetical protein